MMTPLNTSDTQMWRDGHDLLTIQRMLGRSSPMTTMRDLQLSDEEVEAADAVEDAKRQRLAPL